MPTCGVDALRYCGGCAKETPCHPCFSQIPSALPWHLAWEDRKLGTAIGSWCTGKGRLSFLMFADDTTLIAKSRHALQVMMRDIGRALGDVGLKLNPDKCVVQTTCSRNRKGTLTVDGITYPIVPNTKGCKILGTNLTLNANCDVEFESRIAAGWAKYHSLLTLNKSLFNLYSDFTSNLT